MQFFRHIYSFWSANLGIFLLAFAGVVTSGLLYRYRMLKAFRKNHNIS